MAKRRSRSQPVLTVVFEGDPALIRGFKALFGSDFPHIKWVAGEGNPFRDAQIFRRDCPDDTCLVLLDSEGPVTAESHAARGGRDFPVQDTFWMVETMESWLLADVPALENYYGQHFQRNSLPRNPKREAIPRKELSGKLKRATAGTLKGEYHRTRHAPDLLGRVPLNSLEENYPQAKRFVSRLRELV